MENETQEQFNQRHGGKSVTDGNYNYYPDGAVIETSLRGQGVRFEPPTNDPVRLAKNKRVYWAGTKERTERAFRTRQQALLTSIRRSSEEEDFSDVLLSKAKAELVQLRDDALAARKAFDKIDAEYQKLTAPPPPTAEDISRLQELTEHNDMLERQLAAITLDAPAKPKKRKKKAATEEVAQ